jgi:hypothetical protein
MIENMEQIMKMYIASDSEIRNSGEKEMIKK